MNCKWCDHCKSDYLLVWGCNNDHTGNAYVCLNCYSNFTKIPWCDKCPEKILAYVKILGYDKTGDPRYNKTYNVFPVHFQGTT
jgi:predicted amidophosphoribosyltransferase